jgi:hypothetical protein
MKRFFDNLPIAPRIALVLILVALTLACLVAASDDVATKLLLSVLAGLMILIAARLSTPVEVRILWLRHASLIVAASFASGVTFFKNFVEGWLGATISNFAPGFEVPRWSDFLTVLSLCFMFLVIVLVNRYNRIETATPRTRRSILDHPDNRKDRNQLIDDLRNYIERLDDDLNWRHKNFVELEADIDLVLDDGDRRHSVGSLLEAVRNDKKAKLFVLLGDPGSGKSVSLRALTRKLLEKAKKGGPIPIYINLSEWRSDSASNLEEFVLRFLIEKALLDSAASSNDFLEKNFKLLQQEGEFFFILDSFDEIPAILDTNESSPLIRERSESIYLFVRSGNARGMVASRYFRRPTLRSRDRCLLELRPFNEARIAELVSNQATNPKRLQERIFRESALLGTLARNPFLLGLILDYEKHYPKKEMPENQFKLFENYVDQIFAKARDNIKSPCPNLDRLCRDIASFMFERPNLGLEVSMEEVRGEFKKVPNLECVVDFLRMGRFFRISNTNQLSFAHRRFQEYFLVQRFSEKPSQVPIKSIVEDSRWRDSMVLYAEFAPTGEAEKIAEYCWTEMQIIACGNPQADPIAYLRGINAFRFLVEAFRSRPEIVHAFRDTFSDQVRNLLSTFSDQVDQVRNLLSRLGDKKTLEEASRVQPQVVQELRNLIINISKDDRIDLLNAKYAAESVSFLPEARAAEVLIRTLEMECPWIADTAFRACRYLGRVSENVLDALKKYVSELTYRETHDRRQEILIALSFHDQFEPVRQSFRLHDRQRKTCTAVFWTLLLVAPLVWLYFMLVPVIIIFILEMVSLIETDKKSTA